MRRTAYTKIIKGVQDTVKQSVRDAGIGVSSKRVQDLTKEAIEMFLLNIRNETNQYITLVKQKHNTPEIYGIVLGQNPLVWEMLDKLYTQNVYLYEEAYQKANVQYQFLSDNNQTERQIKKALSIVAYAFQENDFQATDMLMKASNSKFHRWLMQLPDRVVDVAALNLYLSNNVVGNKIDTAEALQEMYCYSALLHYLIERNEVLIMEVDDWAEALKAPNNEEFAEYFVVTRIFSLLNTKTSTVKQWATEIEEILEQPIQEFTDALFRKEKETSVITLISRMWDIEGKHYTEPTINWLRDTTHDLHMPEKSYMVFLYLIECNLSSEADMGVIARARLTKEEFQNVLVHTFVNHCHAMEDWMSRFAYTLTLHVLFRELVTSRQQLLSGSYVDVSDAYLEQRDKVYREKEKAMETHIQQLQQENANLIRNHVEMAAHKKVLNENRTLEKRIRELELELERKEEHALEVHALREYVFKEQNQTEAQVTEVNELTEEQKVALNEKNIVIIGGHSNWITNMRKELPNALFLDADATGRDFSRVQQSEVHVFVHTKYNNHGNYYKVLRLLKGDKARLHYISVNNINRVLVEMYESIM